MPLPRPRRAAALATLAGCATVAGSLSLVTPAHADASVTVGTAHDAVADARGTTQATKADVAAFDITTLRTRERLTDQGRLFSQTVLELADGSRLRQARDLKVVVKLAVSGDQPTEATLRVHADGRNRVTVDGEPIVCRDLTVATAPRRNQLLVTYPAACIPGAGPVTAQARLVAYLGGGARVRDAIGATTAAVMDGSSFNAAFLADDADDVTYLIDPAENDYAARGADLTQVAVTSLPGRVRVEAVVEDLSTRRKDPAQAFTFTVSSSGQVVGTFTARVDPANLDTMVPVGECARARFPSEGNTLRLVVPTECLTEPSATLRVQVHSEVTVEDQVAGYDDTATTRLVRLR